MLAMILLVVLMVATVAAFEACMRRSPAGETGEAKEESVESQGEIAGD
ncbi:hypothetical protein OIE66_01845 [Nonomuraea sp. NBC_01738]|nr:hypothetical protein OIE66_01845 [Nonomuraea sp. NBC_01738]